MSKENDAGPLGQKLRSMREAAGLTLYELEKRTGVTRSTLMRLEDGSTRQPATETLNKLAALYEVDPEELYDAAWAEHTGPLPSLRTYFRSKYQLPDDQIETLERIMGTLGDSPTNSQPKTRKPGKERR